MSNPTEQFEGKALKDGPLVPILQEHRQTAVVCMHDCVQNEQIVPFEQHLNAAKQAVSGMLESLAWRVQNGEIQIAVSQPFYLEATLHKETKHGMAGHETITTKKLASKKASITVPFAANLEDTLRPWMEERLPKLLMGLRLTFRNKRATFVQFSLEFSVQEDSAKLSEIKGIIEGARKEKQAKKEAEIVQAARNAGVIVPNFKKDAPTTPPRIILPNE